MTVDSTGLYALDHVPQGVVALGLRSEDREGRRELHRTRTLRVSTDSLYLCDFHTGGGAQVTGSIEMPAFMDGRTIWLELFTDPKAAPVATLEATVGESFLFADVPLDEAGGSLVLRMSLGPGFDVERELHASGPTADFGPIRFASFEDLKAFNRPDGKMFE